MNQLLRKTSFTSGLVLLFTPIVFSSVLTLVLGLQKVLYTFDTSMGVLYIVFLIVSILEVIFFIKIFRAYRLREPHAYYLVYFLGILATLGMIGISGVGAFQYLQILKIIFSFILLFALFSFRYQKESFLATVSPSEVRKNVLTFLISAVIVGIISFPISINFIWEHSISPYFLSALFSLVFIYWWRKRVNTGILHGFIFLPGFYITATHLIWQLTILTIFYDIFIFWVTSFLSGRPL